MTGARRVRAPPAERRDRTPDEPWVVGRRGLVRDAGVDQRARQCGLHDHDVDGREEPTHDVGAAACFRSSASERLPRWYAARPPGIVRTGSFPSGGSTRIDLRTEVGERQGAERARGTSG